MGSIQMRRGLLADFDPWKMMPGEWGVSIDTTTGNQCIYMCFSSGVVKRIGTLEDLEEIIKSSKEEVRAELEQFFQYYLTLISNRADQAVDAAEAAVEKVSDNELLIAVMQESLNGKIDGAYADDEGFLYLTSDGNVIAGPIGPFAGGTGGGGGGGNAGNNAVLSMTNTTGWLMGNFAQDQTCEISFNWSSVEGDIPTGNGTVSINVGGTVAGILNVEQGDVTIDLTKYLKAGTNAVRVTLTDVYGNSRYIAFQIKVVAIKLDSTFDDSSPFEGFINYTYIPTGAVSKTVHFILDGKELGTTVVSGSGKQQSYLIPAQSHGSHSLEVYFEAVVEGMRVESNHLYYDLVCIVEGNLTPIISINYNQKIVSQYDTVFIPYKVYSPSSLTSQVTLKEGTEIHANLTVDRTTQTWRYRVNEAGSHTLTIESQGISKSVSFTATETFIDAEAETQDLSLYLSSYGRSNGEAEPAKWESGEIKCTFENFNFISDGWQADDNGISVLRVSGDGRLTIPFKPFEQDFRTTGKTIEIELATRDVIDYDAEIVKCFSGNRGIVMTGQQATLKSEQSEIGIQYKEDTQVRISFVVTKRNENRLILCYIDGVMSGAIRYPEDDDFSQTEPVNISIGSNECTVDLYTIRIYENNLTPQQMLDNWIADTQIGSLMMDRYMHNDVFDDYGAIDYQKLPSDLPYIIWDAEELPQYKGNKLSVGGSYTDPVDTDKSFSFETSSIDVQGTSSQYYARKNYKEKFSDGFTTSKGKIDKYKLREDSIPVNTFTFKADVASSEGANNVELVKLYNDTCPVKSPPMLENPAIRWGIDGKPIVAFQRKESGVEFIGKYNFNNDKGTEEVYGFEQGDESWEVLNNTDDLVLFKSDDFSSWQNSFEARYPEDNTDISNLKAFVSWVLSTKDNKTKFKSELSNWCNLQSALFYWLFTETFLMVDSRAKNAFPTRFGKDGKWYWLPYDFDTALGINNEGVLAFGYSLEDTDKLEGDVDVFNGQDSIFWNNLRDCFSDEIAAMYKDLRSTGAWSYEKIAGMFTEHQAKWPVAVINEDSQFKYLDPLINEGNGSYLGMLQGTKSSQRAWWLYNRMRYMDSKFNAGDDMTDVITVRGYNKADITVIPYADLYVNIKYGSVLVSERGQRNQSYTLPCPLSNVNDTEIYVYSASQLSSVGDLSGLKVGYADFAKAVKLKDLKLGDSSSSYSNPNLSEVSLGNNRLLKTLDLRNCTNFTQTVDVSGCKNIESIYMEGTQVNGINLPNGGILKTLHLPATLSNLTILNHKGITDLSVPNYSGLTTLRLENVSENIPIDTILGQLQNQARVRLVGFHWEKENTSGIVELFDLFDTFRGLDETGQNMDKAQVSGTIHVPSILGSEAAELQARYPYVTINADHISCKVYYYNYDGSSLLYTEEVIDGADATYSGKPTRSADAQYKYTFAGWALSPNGSANSTAQKSITADKKLYAAYTTETQKYRVRYYCGTELKATVENVPYGGSATYPYSTSDLVDPSGDGMPFESWQPTGKNITGNTDCYAQFEQALQIKEIEEDWDEIIRVAKQGPEAVRAKGWRVGNYKPIPNGLGTEYEGNAEIIGIGVDKKADGSGMAGISFGLCDLLTTSKRWNPSRSGSSGDYTEGTGPIGGWEKSELRPYYNETLFNLFPDNIRNAIVEVEKTQIAYNPAGSSYTQTTTEKVWPFSYPELFSTAANGGLYESRFKRTNANRIKHKWNSTSASSYWLRSANFSNFVYCVSTSGGSGNNISYNTYALPLGFSI